MNRDRTAEGEGGRKEGREEEGQMQGVRREGKGKVMEWEERRDRRERER